MAVSPDDRGSPASAARAATVEFDHVSKAYGPTRTGASRAPQPAAVSDLSLAIPAGRICVLVGPSGCGKTTSLKMVNRLIEPTSGRILLDGVDAATRDVTDLRRGIGYVIQQTGLFPHQTIIDNVGTVPRLLNWPAGRIRERSEELLALVGLDPTLYARRFPSQLSGGERQRVGVARALAADPPVMLMDEPFGAVDPIVRERLQDEFLRLQAELAKTILFVTHDIDEAIKMGDLVAVFEQGGHVAQFGTPAELLASPASDFVARFVGADRGLKRLSLSRVRDLNLRAATMGRVGEAMDDARRRAEADPFPYLLLVDNRDRPLGWLRDSDLQADGELGEAMAISMSPLLSGETTLKDALSMMLDADVHAGIVVDRDDRVRGLVTTDMIGGFLRDPDSTDHAPAPARPEAPARHETPAGPEAPGS
ncbi:MAG: ABC transporter ATP-binding protein [Candidatus Limnocylindrales bacterium]